LPPDVEIVNSEVSKAEKDDEPTQIRPRFYEEEPVLRIPTPHNPPSIVIPSTKAIPRNTREVSKGIIGALARFIGDKCMSHRQSLQGQIDHRLKQQINEKKLAMGLKIENAQKASYQTEEEYEQSM